MTLKRGLGKGLSDLGLNALLGDLKKAPTPIQSIETPTPEVISHTVDGELKKLPMDTLKPGKYQPRKLLAPEALEELADSIRTQGVIQPIIVRKIENNQFEIIAGERRWRAAKLAGLNYIPAIIRDIPDETAMVMALIENIQRRDLNVMEEAVALNRLMTEFEMTHQAVADAVGKSRTNVTNILRLLKLNSHVRKLVENGELEMGHARALLTVDEENQTKIANMVVMRKLSVRETESLIRNLLEKKDHQPSQKIILHSVQDHLARKFGVKVSVIKNAKGRGKVIMQYRNERELEKLLTQLE